MGKQFSCCARIFGVLFILSVIYNEYIIYTLNSWTWAKMRCKDESNCLKILLVADPQLIGEKNEIYHTITPISIWDSDRYLRKTYTLAVGHFAPDVIVFLGDLFDEGSIASTAQYIRYLKRLFSIFTTEYPIRHIWLPGDNDIGGETERVTDEKIKRFEDAFPQPPVIDVKHVRFSKVNRMIRDPPKSFDYVDNNTDKISVVVSHMPLVLVSSTYVEKVLEVLKPKVIFAAHEHKSRIIWTNIWHQNRRAEDLNEHDGRIYKYKLEKEKIFELLVPTCSYRMGTDNIGYGAAIIESDATMQYTIFWSTNRFNNLTIYMLLIIVVVGYFTTNYVFKKFFRPRIIHISKQQYTYTIIKNGV